MLFDMLERPGLEKRQKEMISHSASTPSLSTLGSCDGIASILPVRKGIEFKTLTNVKNSKAKDYLHSHANDGVIPCLYMPYQNGSSKLLIYFHGNAVDIGISRDMLLKIKDKLKVSIQNFEAIVYSQRSFR